MATRTNSTSRRTLLAAAAGTAAALASPAVAEQIPAADAELIKLGRRHDLLMERVDLTYEAVDDGETEVYRALGDAPAALLHRGGQDWAAGLRLPHHPQRHYQLSDLDMARAAHATGQGRSATNEVAQRRAARVAEVLAALEERNSRRDELKIAYGVTLAEEAWRNALAELETVDDRIAELPATTPAGWAAKAKAALRYSDSIDCDRGAKLFAQVMTMLSQAA